MLQRSKWTGEYIDRVPVPPCVIEKYGRAVANDNLGDPRVDTGQYRRRDDADREQLINRNRILRIGKPPMEPDRQPSPGGDERDAAA